MKRQDTQLFDMDAHSQLVSSLASQVAGFHREKKPFRIYHGSTNSTRTTTFSDATSINTSALNNILSVDSQARTCLVESNVPMDKLVAATQPFRLVPPVVPEFPGITVGGAFSGTGGESSSFRYGFFDQCVTWIEVILADGSIMEASPEKNADLFHGCCGTFGTIAIVTMMEVQLIAAKDFVELTYHPIASFQQAQDVMRELEVQHHFEFVERPKVGFLDGIMFSKSHGVVVSGRMADREDYCPTACPPVTTWSKRWDQWYYLHAEEVARNNPIRTAPYKELATIPEYLFRYDRGAFWTGLFVFEWFGIPFNRITRYILDWLMSTRTLYHGLHASKLGAGYIIQDLSIPNSRAVEFLEWLDDEYTAYPLWLCPIQMNERISMNPHVTSLTEPDGTTGEAMLNIGVWTKCPAEGRVPANRKLEAKVRACNGMKWLYAETFYTKEVFWKIYPRQWYEKLRQRYGAEYLPDVYEKVRTVVKHDVGKHEKGGSTRWWRKCALRDLNLWNRWPLAGVAAVISHLSGTEYLKVSD